MLNSFSCVSTSLLGPCGCEHDKSLLYVSQASDFGLMKIDDTGRVIEGNSRFECFPQPTTMQFCINKSEHQNKNNHEALFIYLFYSKLIP
jgi:hypothetical protein